MAGATQLVKDSSKGTFGHKSQKSYDRVAIPLPLARLKARVAAKQEEIESTATVPVREENEDQTIRAAASRGQGNDLASGASRQNAGTDIVYTPESRTSDDIKVPESIDQGNQLANCAVQDTSPMFGGVEDLASQQHEQNRPLQLNDREDLAVRSTPHQLESSELGIGTHDFRQLSNGLDDALQQTSAIAQTSNLEKKHPNRREHQVRSRQQHASLNAEYLVGSQLQGLEYNQRMQTTRHEDISMLPTAIRSRVSLSGTSALLANRDLLVQHITSSMDSTAFYPDISVHVTDLHGYHFERGAHRMLLARSHRLRKIMADAQSAQPLQLTLPGHWMSVCGFHVMFEWLYGREVLTAALIVSGQDILHIETLLAAISVAHFLELGDAAAELTMVASSMLQWDSILVALHFALDGTFSSVMDWSAHMSSPFSSRSTPRPYNDPEATRLLHAVIHFLLYNFPNDFYSDAQAKEPGFMQRLPASLQPAEVLATSPIELQIPGHRASQSLNGARLSQIRFGQAGPSETHGKSVRPTTVNAILSSVLYSLPFGLLKLLLEHPVLVERIGAETVASVMRQIIAERETRREVANRALRFSGKVPEMVLDFAAQNSFWEERLEESSKTMVGLQIMRHKLGE